jgi:Kef-type K+ transport system membrane component KefB
MNGLRNKKAGLERKTIYYGRIMAMILGTTGTVLIVSTPFLLWATKQALMGSSWPGEHLQESSVAAILMTFCVFILLSALIMIIGAIIIGVLLPSRMTYESNVSEGTDEEIAK